MEALIVTGATLVVVVLLEAGCWIALCLMRWAPSLGFGALVTWLLYRNGLESVEALGFGILAIFFTRLVLSLGFFPRLPARLM